MEYQLSIYDRFTLLSALPPAQSYVTMRVVMDLTAALPLSETELADAHVEQGADGFLRWRQGAVPDKAVEIGAVGLTIIRDGLAQRAKELDANQAITVEFLRLLDRFEVVYAPPEEVESDSDG